MFKHSRKIRKIQHPACKIVLKILFKITTKVKNRCESKTIILVRTKHPNVTYLRSSKTVSNCRTAPNEFAANSRYQSRDMLTNLLYITKGSVHGYLGTCQLCLFRGTVRACNKHRQGCIYMIIYPIPT